VKWNPLPAGTPVDTEDHPDMAKRVPGSHCHNQECMHQRDAFSQLRARQCSNAPE